jgi:chemotaxis protein MotB
MSTQSSAELLKEQLRLKNMELKKRDAEKVKIEEKVKHILAVKEQRFTEMQNEVEKKTQSRLQAMAGHVSQIQNKAAPVETKEVIVQDPKLTQAINELKTKNNDLTNQINQALGERAKFAKERETLIGEIRKLRDSPDSADKLKTKVLALEGRFKELQSRNEALLREKEGLGSQMPMSASRDDYPIFGSPQQLQEELEEEKKKNEELKSKLENEARKFELKLNKEIEKMREELESKSQKIRRGRRSANISEEKEGGAAGVHAPFWMITFADMSALLLAFFIVLYTMAADNISKVKTLLTGDESGGIGMMDFLDSIDMKEKLKAFSTTKSKDILNEVNKLAQEKDSQVDVSSGQGKIVMRVPGNALFPPGKANLQKEGRPVLDQLIKTIKQYPQYKINIQGHTDDTSIASEMFPTNWELSAARATAVLRYFLDKGIEPTKLTATGFADIFPLISNDTEEGRAQNRRVEIVLEKEK